MSETKTRIGGSGFTQFQWQGTTLSWMQVLQDTSPAPVAGAQPVQPMDAPTPIEIANARAVGVGTLRLTLFELWNINVWQQLPGLGNATSLLQVFNTQVNLGNITCRKIIKTPSSIGGYRIKVYNNCVITDVDDGETIQIGTMLLPKGLTINYCSFSVVNR